MRALPLLVLVAAACAPELERPAWRVDGPRVLAIRAEPAEAAPGSAVQLEALVVAPDEAPAPRWALCLRQRALAESGSVAKDCLEPAAAWLRELGEGPRVGASLPADSCALFGPETPPARPGEAPLRPQDPDATGGYYVPVRAGLEGQLAFGGVRLRCQLPQAPAPVARELKDRYVANTHPRGLQLLLEGTPAPGSELTLRASFDAGAAEPYPVFQLATASLEDRVETLRVSWFTTAGALGAQSVRVEPGAAEAETTWRAPETAGTALLWAVLRDDRGGVAWTSLRVEIP